MINTLLAWIVGIVAAFLLGMSYQHRQDITRSQAKQAVALTTARETEHKQQGEVDETLKRQNAELASVNASLRRDLDRVRQRQARARVPKASAPECARATGAELSREDAEFLVGEAARADRLRGALRACYSYADTVAP